MYLCLYEKYITICRTDLCCLNKRDELGSSRLHAGTDINSRTLRIRFHNYFLATTRIVYIASI